MYTITGMIDASIYVGQSVTAVQAMLRLVANINGLVDLIIILVVSLIALLLIQ
jgi:hypothetical protein